MSTNRTETKEIRLAFVTENDFFGKVNPATGNRRTEFEWMIMLDAFHIPWQVLEQEPDQLKDFDAVIFVLPKSQPNYIHLIYKIKDITKILMQEGPSNLWQEYPTSFQIEYYKLLQSIDAIFCHNEYDKKYFSGLTNQPIYILPTFINLAFIQNIGKAKQKLKGTVMIGGNGTNWYNGVSSLCVVKDFKDIILICFPSMGRMLENEPVLMSEIAKKDIRYIPYIDWSKFTSTLSQFEYAVHLMPTKAAGSFHAQCAVMGVPCIGTKDIDTQRICFPDLCVDDPYDIPKAKELMKRLIEDKDFYDSCVKKAQKNVEQLNASLCAIKVKENIKEVIENGKA